MRVVSLLPSATEIICRVGGGPLLVGRSHECDHPAGSVAGAAVLTAPVPAAAYDRDANISPAAVDATVRQAVADGNSLYRLDGALLAELRPDVIVTQDLCDVCSIDLEAVHAAADRLEPRPEIVSLNPHTLEGVLDDVLTVGRAIGCEPAARSAAVDLRGQIFDAESYVNPFFDGPTVGFLEWTDPLYVAGHWNVEIIERAGGRHPLNETAPIPGNGAAVGPQRGERRAGRSIAVPAEVFAATRPDALVIVPCGLSLEDAAHEARQLRESARASGWWDDLPAVRSGRVAIVDGNQMFNRPGPRLIDAYRWLVGWLNDRPAMMPDGFPWRPLDPG